MGAAREGEEAAFLGNSSSHGRSDGAILVALTTGTSAAQAQAVDQQAQYMLKAKQFLRGVHSSRTDELLAAWLCQGIHLVQ